MRTAGTEAELNLKGNKEIIPGEGLTNAPTLADDTFTFEITGNAADDGTPAPMPENTAAVNKICNHCNECGYDTQTEKIEPGNSLNDKNKVL